MSTKLNQTITTRFSLADYLRIQTAAEHEGCTTSQILRDMWAKNIQFQSFKQELFSLENRLTRNFFETLVIALELDDDEKAKVLSVTCPQP